MLVQRIFCCSVTLISTYIETIGRATNAHFVLIFVQARPLSILVERFNIDGQIDQELVVMDWVVNVLGVSDLLLAFGGDIRVKRMVG